MVFHSDRGSVYTSRTFAELCDSHRVVQSMGATGVCWDNAVAEAFFATLKADLRSELGPMAAAATVHAWVAADGIVAV